MVAAWPVKWSKDYAVIVCPARFHVKLLNASICNALINWIIETGKGRIRSIGNGFACKSFEMGNVF